MTTPTCDFAMLLAVGSSALPVAVTLLLAESWASGFVMSWLASINLFNAWRAWRCLPGALPTETRFSLRDLLIPRAVATSVNSHLIKGFRCISTTAARVMPPRFSLRALLLSVLVCAAVFSWLKVREDERKIERRNELQRRLAILESEHHALAWRVAHSYSGDDAGERFNDRYMLQQTHLEIEQIRSQLGQAASK